MAPPGKKRGAAPDTKRTKKRVPDPNGAGKELRVDPSATAEQVLRSKKSANLVFDLLELLEVRPAQEAEATWPRPLHLCQCSAQVRFVSDLPVSRHSAALGTALSKQRGSVDVTGTRLIAHRRRGETQKSNAFEVFEPFQ